MIAYGVSQNHYKEIEYGWKTTGGLERMRACKGGCAYGSPTPPKPLMRAVER
jgi:hypothetical protein